ncbi:Uu.00g126660.m01.CDS01 [Anthostomella pinea]|uniref:Uu.00g126660.m01.CDS01 n=1 Tax=Anthostomella pinea TaxID=933095 RepID=A0AAI8VCP9_9PEZI|nr:Uu.00g126660.m01.CDS01 [Anthostomella pinea]
MAPQDSFIDDEEDTCPLCIEEFDLSDRNFRPCPCGYQVGEHISPTCFMGIQQLNIASASQICQFCFNNLKNNLSGLCPACRRPYDEKDIEFKVVTHEEEAEFRANIQKNQKKRATEQRQKEVQKREAEKENRKNLQGVRVVQKNLVYVTGLTPTVREDELLKTLRKPEFFGQYGNIQKISISNRKSSDGQQQSLGIYVTFEKKDDAARCIQAVHGSQNGDRVLKAQLGTTKYCSAWLRHEQCGNRQCMFLHELGDEEDSYTRQDLSSLNSVHTQRPFSTAASSSRSVSRQQGSAAPSTATSQPMVRASSKEGSDVGDGPALPASANWARTTQQRSRRGSHATSGATSSPAISNSLPVTAESAQEAVDNAPVAEIPDLTSRKAEKQPATDTPNTASATGTRPHAERKSDMEFSAIWRMLAASSPSAFVPPKDAEDSYPPLFDVNGAERRRAMRDEDENRTGEHEDQADILETSEGEPESGSLALGGEPEDRDHGRNSVSFDQARSLAQQPPIQRTKAFANDLFGPSLTGFGQGAAAAASVGSIGSRTMTTQQQPGIRGQGGFAEQMLPPGIATQQSGLFQGQGGHTRQQSRFSFANENSSSSVNVKTSENPRYMAQQSAMMPSTFRSQPYTSVPGPPPGLKSTGTPPVGGSMFGGLPFAQMPLATATSKENTELLLQSMLRGRGAGSSHAHDAGKREFFSNSFQNQYPPSTSSTTAPVSALGLLASLYASQPGAFPDYGPKQKKKGKKHRHANTSSSGGGALVVDLADPSILQARMHHQQQQGNIFGGQTQGGYNPNTMYGGGGGGGYSRWQAIVVFHKVSSYDDLLPLDEASFSVDALVADSDSPEPQEPLLRNGITTPSLPPGLGLSHAHPPVQFGERNPSPVPQDRLDAGTATTRPVTPAVPRPVTPLVPKSAVKSTPLRGKEEAPTVDNDAKKSIKELATTSGLAKDIAAQASKTPVGKLLQDEDFPALDSVKTGSPSRQTPALPSKPMQNVKTPSAKTPSAKTAIDVSSSKASSQKTPNKSDKRPMPGALDIAAATKTLNQSGASGSTTDTSEKPSAQPASAVQLNKIQGASALPTPTPTSASVSSPFAKAAPKTLRLVQTPKTEAPPINIAPAAVASIRSAAAASSAHRPATPASDLVSDTASIVSASISASRTSSPPPSRVGSAAVRATTKSQQRKQRKDASKEAAAQIAESKSIEEEVEIAPILGRKKKQKKERKTAPTSRVPSRPGTPTAPDSHGDVSTTEKGTTMPAADVSGDPGACAEDIVWTGESSKPKELKGKDLNSPPRSPAAIDTSIRLNESTKTTVLTPDYVSHTPDSMQVQSLEEDVGEVPSLRDIFRALVQAGALPDPEKMNFFKPSPGYRFESFNSTAVSLPPTLKAIVMKEDEEKLNAFQPVRKSVNDHPVLLTPNGDCLLNLTQDEADLFLELQDRLRADSIRPTAFSAPRYAPANGFSLVKNRAVPNGTPSFFPGGPDNYPSDPVGKMHREEAISCINQHVLPSLNLGSYKTMGPNSNFTKNVNLQQLAPWIYPSADSVEDQRKMFSGRAGEDFGGVAGGHAADGVYASYDNPEGGASPAIGSTPLMSVEDAETVWSQSKKQHEALDKKFRQLQAKNRRLVDMN